MKLQVKLQIICLTLLTISCPAFGMEGGNNNNNNNTVAQNPFDKLPEEITLKILSFLPYLDAVKNMGLLNKDFNLFMKDLSLAKQFVEQEAATYGITPMQVAFDYDLALIVADYLEKGQKLEDIKTKQTKTPIKPLIYAALKGSVRIARVLLEHGFGKNTTTFSNKDPHKLTDEQINDLLLKGAQRFCNATTTKEPAKIRAGRSSAHYSEIDVMYAYDACHPMAAHLKEKPKFIHTAEKTTGSLPLMHAAELNAVHIAKLLLKKGADANARHKTTSHTALMFAALYNSLAVAELLIKNGADIEATDTGIDLSPYIGDADDEDNDDDDADYGDTVGFTPLILALHYKSFDVAKLLIEKGANLNADVLSYIEKDEELKQFLVRHRKPNNSNNNNDNNQ